MFVPCVWRRLSFVSSDHLAEINAQAQMHLARVREAAQAAHERLESGLLNAGAETRPIEPDNEQPEEPRASLVDWDDPPNYEPEQ